MILDQMKWIIRKAESDIARQKTITASPETDPQTLMRRYTDLERKHHWFVKNMGTFVDNLSRESNECYTYDSLTRVFTRKYMMEVIQNEMKQARASEDSFVVAMMDLDNFKAINDRYGHLAGDIVLRHVATCIKSSIRVGDFIGRYGGDEFILLFPNTDKKNASQILKRLCECISSNTLKFGKDDISVSASFGYCMFENKAISKKDDLIYYADQGLLKAKKNGKSQIVSFDLKTNIIEEREVVIQ